MCSQIHFMITKTKPDFVVFEKISLHSSVKTLTLLARLQGSIMQSCYINHVDFAMYAPSTWRRLLGLLHGGKAMREEHKKRAIAFVRNGYGIKVGDDCAEAICIGVAHLKNTHILTD